MMFIGRWRTTAVYRSASVPIAVDPWATYPLFGASGDRYRYAR